MLVCFGVPPVDGICSHCGVHTAGGGFPGVFAVAAAGAAMVGLVVARATGAAAGAAGAGLTGHSPCEGSGVAGATSVTLDVSGLTASGWCLWI